MVGALAHGRSRTVRRPLPAPAHRRRRGSGAEAPGRPGGAALPAPTPAPPRRPPYRHTKELLTHESIERLGLTAQTIPDTPLNPRFYARSGAARKVPLLRNQPDTSSSRSATRRSWAGPGDGGGE